MGYYNDYKDLFEPYDMDETDEDEDIYEHVTLVHQTEKAYLIRLDDKTEFWAPKVAIKFFDDTTISVATWFTIKGTREA